MIIRRLSMNNFGVYAGLNTFEFHNKKPVVLIGGMNGRGKTTFLEAVLLALYGASSFAYVESKYQSYGQYLKSFVNKSDGTMNCYVELAFKLETEHQEHFLIRREWSGASQRIREKIYVEKDGEYNTFLTENWAMFIENILPSGLSSFFFFDGEKIAELAVESTNAQMKESIKSLLGISVLDMLGNDIARIMTKVNKHSRNAMNTKEMEILRERKNMADTALQIADDRITDTCKRIEDAKKKLEKANFEYTAKGGNIVAQQQELLNQRTHLSLKIEQVKEQMVNVAAGSLPLNLVKKLLLNIQDQAKKEHETKILNFAVDKITSLFQVYSKTDVNNTDSVRAFIDYVQIQSKQEKTEIVYNLSEQSLFQLNNFLCSEMATVKAGAKNMMRGLEVQKSKMDELDSYLSVDIDEKVLSKIYKRIKTLEQEIFNLEVELDLQQNKRVSLNGDAIKATTEYNRYVESLLEKLEMNDDSNRILKYSHQITEILNEYKIRLQKKKTGVLAKTMSDCYKKLAYKKNLIDQIEMDPVTLDFIYIDSDKNLVPKESLSAGEKQLMVVSLLWALAICSKKKLPVIIDTPLSRLDSNHRISLITTYFPQASEQTIILSTDSEIDENYYNMMKENVGDEFTLIYDDEKKCTTIERGYFVGDNI